MPITKEKYYSDILTINKTNAYLHKLGFAFFTQTCLYIAIKNK